MSVAVLQSKAQIEQSRRTLLARGISRMTRFAFVKRLLRRVTVGDPVKSWDVELSASYLYKHLPCSARILDLGSFASELPYVLQASGYRALFGIDTNPRLQAMPAGVRHVRGDFHRAPFPDASFDAITSISVIEHGWDGERLFAEVSRLLRDGGVFLASTDYWPEKLETDGLEAFGVSWTIFSRDEILRMIDLAGRYDLHPAGDIELHASETPIAWNGRKYTFAWIALRKGAP